jgi:hypothetical protein
MWMKELRMRMNKSRMRYHRQRKAFGLEVSKDDI